MKRILCVLVGLLVACGDDDCTDCADAAIDAVVVDGRMTDASPTDAENADVGITDGAVADGGDDAGQGTCGDGMCGGSESCSTCEMDCGACPVRDTAHSDIAPDGFAGSIDFVDAILDADRTGVTHTIIVERYHGSAGAVSVSYQSAGAPHEMASGTLSWADGELGRKSFTLHVSDHALAGEERVYVDLADPTGGARLGRGAYSRMYIVTDDGSAAADAVWANAESGDDGADGSMASPVRTVVRAIALAEERSAGFVYLEGVFPITEEETISNFGNPLNGIYLPTRNSEGERLVIRSAPGQAATIDGVDNAGLDRMGFFASDRAIHSGNFITVSHLNFRRLVGAVVYRYAEGRHPTVEHCDVRDIDGVRGSNVSGIAPWGVASFIIHNNYVETVRVDGERNGNGACLQTYGGANVFAQQNTLVDCDNGFYHKLSPQEDDGTQHASLIFRRNVGWNVHGAVRFDIQGGGSPGHSYSLVSQNLFRIVHPGGGFSIRAGANTQLPLGVHNEFSHNIIDRRTVRSDYVALYGQNHLHTSFYANIILDGESSRFMQRHLFSADAAGYPEPMTPPDGLLFDYFDDNVYMTEGAAPIVYTKGRDYNHQASIEEARGWGIEGASVITDSVPFMSLPAVDGDFLSGDYHIRSDAPEASAAPGGLPVGVYVYGDEQLGAR